METAKKEALKAIRALPDDADIDDIMYRLYVLDKIRKGREAARDGRTILAAELKGAIEKW